MDYGFYNPYNGYSMQSNGFQFNPMNRYQQGTQMPPQAQQNGPDWIMAPSIKQVEQVSVQPGQKAWIMVQNAPVFSLRTADNMGLVTTDYYRFEKFNPGDSAEPANDYVTRKEFEDFVASLKKESME